MLTRRHRAIAHAVEQSTFLPFLYHTRTIARQYATAPDAIDEALNSGLDYKPSQYKPSQSRRPPQRSDHPRSHTYEPYAPREFTDHVPFEGVGRSKDAHAEFEGSTVTLKERKAFEGLFKLRTAKDEQEVETEDIDPAKPERRRSSLDDIMDSAGAEAEEGPNTQSQYTPALQRMAHEAREQRRRTPSQGDAIDAAAAKDIETISKRFDAAKTDVEIWEVLQSIFERVAVLNLEDSPSKTGKPGRPKARNTTPAKDGKKLSKPHKDLEILTRTLPVHLTRAMGILKSHFPASSLQLSLLPYLRTLGPTAFALGASTQLYNQHMAALWHYTPTDLDSLVDVLREMDEQVYAYDEFTQKLLERVFRHDVGVRKIGVRGAAVKGFWEGEGMKKKVRRVAWWDDRVRERREEEALRRTRVEEERRREEGVEGESV